MKHSIKISVMALIAMFAFNEVASAQFGIGRALAGAAKKKQQQNAISAYTTGPTSKYDNSGKTVRDGQVYFNGQPVDMTYKEVTVKNWKTGEMETVENICVRGDGRPEEPKTSQDIYKDEVNFQDKEMKTKIVDAFMEEEKFNDRKRAADDMLKGRKVVDVLFKYRDWQIQRDKYENITDRYMFVYVISELTNGYTIVEDYKVTSRYEGGGSYSNSFLFKFYEDYWKAYGRPGHSVPYRWMVTDWEHKAE